MTRARALAPAAAIAVTAIALRIVFAPQLDILDDAGYLEAARRVSQGLSLDHLFPLFRLRVGMAYPLGWLMAGHVLEPARFWWLTVAGDLWALIAMAWAAWAFTSTIEAALCTAAVYAIYPLAVQQSAMYYPTSFQVASIATACALIASAEPLPHLRRYGLALLAGVSLGIGYLFKEDVAIVVPAMVLASLVASFPRFTTMIAVGSGAAVIFLAECAGYWMTTGHPLFRLTATSGLGSPLGTDLQIAEIWKWYAYPRSLWLMPLQVGILWWLALPATWMAWRSRRRAPGIAFAAALLVILMLYLQFGSGSFSTYSPLPKTPRYTALATPLLMLVTGAWLASLLATRPRAGRVVAAAIVVTALPCLLFLHMSASERTRNTLAAATVLHGLGPGALHTDYYSARVLRLIDPDRDIRVWYHANFDTRQITMPSPPPAGSYALLDHQAAKVYTSSYQMPLPPAITNVPEDATVIWTHRAYPEGSAMRRLLEGIRRAAASFPNGNPVAGRLERNIADMIDGDDAVLYRLSPPPAR